MKGAMIARSPADGQGEDAPAVAWQVALQTVVSDSDELLTLLGLSADDLAIDRGQTFPLRVPRAFVARMQPGRADDPLLRQVLPVVAERARMPGFTVDPLAEAEANPVPGLIHKYRGRVLLIVNGHCAIHCRYCFRRHFPYAAQQASKGEWSRAFDYIARDDSIREVILSGGDPLSVPDRHLQWLISQVEAIPGVARLRIHSRLPVVIPQRITPALVAVLAGSRLQASLVIHANHAQELDDSVAAALWPAAPRRRSPCSTRRCCWPASMTEARGAERAVRAPVRDRRPALLPPPARSGCWRRAFRSQRGARTGAARSAARASARLSRPAVRARGRAGGVEDTASSAAKLTRAAASMLPGWIAALPGRARFPTS
jgi:EF-P beta-lysylation protein EpmB